MKQRYCIWLINDKAYYGDEHSRPTRFISYATAVRKMRMLQVNAFIDPVELTFGGWRRAP